MSQPTPVNQPIPTLFVLQRDEDVSGVSGTGVVAEGILFSDGRVAIRWCVPAQHQSTATWDSIEAVRAIHGHDGRTRIVWAIPDGISWRSEVPDEEA